MWIINSALAQLASAAVTTRNLCFQKGFFSSQALAHPVVSVGNLTLGGTGKTPVVIFLARLLQRAGYQPVVLTRGYKRQQGPEVLTVSDGRKLLCSFEESGDEALLLARELEGVPVVVGRDRYRAGRAAEDRQPGKLVYLLDDGFQHLRLKRNLNLLLIDATDPFGGGRLFPAGRLREPLRGLRRADWVIITRSHIGRDTEEAEMEIRRWNRTVPISYFHHDATALRELKSGRSLPMRDFMGKPVTALAAVGNPAVFLHDLAHYQMRSVDLAFFRDHHRFRQSEIDQVLERQSAQGSEAVVTTEKDAVRLEGLDFPEGKVFALRIQALPEEPEEFQKQLLMEMEALPKAR